MAPEKSSPSNGVASHRLLIGLMEGMHVLESRLEPPKASSLLPDENSFILTGSLRSSTTSSSGVCEEQPAVRLDGMIMRPTAEANASWRMVAGNLEYQIHTLVIMDSPS